MRSCVIALIAVSMSISAYAAPLSGGVGEPPASGAIRVEDDEPFPHTPPARPAAEQKPRPGNCRSYTPPYRNGVCPADARPQQPSAAKVKSVRNAPLPEKKTENKTARRGLSDSDRPSQATKPVIFSASHVAVTAAPAGLEARRSVATTLHAMTGHLFFSGFAGKHPTDAAVSAISGALRKGLLGGVIVSDANIASDRQLHALLQTIRQESGEDYPFIAVEQPGGPDSALSQDKGFAFYASANAASGAGGQHEAQVMYRDMAGELFSLGVTVNIGPSADVCSKAGVDLSAPCFGTAASRVADYAAAFSFGHHDRGVLTALRHVPDRLGLASWKTERASVAMLRRLAQAEPCDALVIRVKAVEPVSPAAARPDWTPVSGESKLRRAYGFRGAVIYDLDVGANGAPLRYGEAIVRAFESGADIVMVKDVSALPAELSTIGVEAVDEGMRSGRLQKARIEDAYAQVQRLKERLRVLQSRARMAETFTP
jgi:beta-N-acetylhexosaminidase